MKLLLRSMLFVTAHNEKFIEKSVQTDADALIMDMEDSVPDDCKEKARTLLRSYLERGALAGKQVFVRTNPLDSEHFARDVDAAMHKDILGFMPPKIQSRDDIVFLEKLLTQKENEHGLAPGSFKLAPLVETTAAVLNLSEIIRDNRRIVAIAFGGEDFLNDLEGLHGEPPIAFDVPRALIAMAARSIGIAPIDTPFLDLKDADGFVHEKKEAFELGFAGSLLINPRQIAPANACFTPDADEIARAKEIIEAIRVSKEQGAGCVMLGERMVGPPMRRKAEQIVALVDLIENKKGRASRPSSGCVGATVRSPAVAKQRCKTQMPRRMPGCPVIMMPGCLKVVMPG
ncbi:MAG: CoA ester lyase [Clostridiales Family XIII bacterium]|jgi:citrate lyase subunit beta/citryl-CoA lyase|nr:CoA ester lyase [Clostridiales Family XIII bacterium]